MLFGRDHRPQGWHYPPIKQRRRLHRQVLCPQHTSVAVHFFYTSVFHTFIPFTQTELHEMFRQTRALLVITRTFRPNFISTHTNKKEPHPSHPPKARGADAKRGKEEGRTQRYLDLPFTRVTILDGQILDLGVSLICLPPRSHVATRTRLGGEDRHRTSGGRLLRTLRLLKGYEFPKGKR